MRIPLNHVVIGALAVLAASCAPPPESHDAADIGAMMHATFDRPDAPLIAEPIVVSGDYAVADWTQGERGGRALIKRTEGEWRIVLCAGDGIRTAAGMQGAGVPIEHAQDLARKLADAERHVPAERVHSMASFEGIVRMDGASGHPVSH